MIQAENSHTLDAPSAVRDFSKYQCHLQGCEKEFLSKRALKEHLNSHYEVLPYKW
jgi:hypothetical protein